MPKQKKSFNALGFVEYRTLLNEAILKADKEAEHQVLEMASKEYYEIIKSQQIIDDLRSTD